MHHLPSQTQPQMLCRRAAWYGPQWNIPISLTDIDRRLTNASLALTWYMGVAASRLLSCILSLTEVSLMNTWEHCPHTTDQPMDTDQLLVPNHTNTRHSLSCCLVWFLNPDCKAFLRWNYGLTPISGHWIPFSLINAFVSQQPVEPIPGQRILLIPGRRTPTPQPDGPANIPVPDAGPV